MSSNKQHIRFGIIGLGLMGREFASAAARWAHLLNVNFQPRIVAICDTSPVLFDWFEQNFDSVTLSTTDYHDLLDSDEIDAIYCAVPHHLHQTMYIDVIRAGKHLLGEKPFGIDAAANAAILATIEQHPNVVVACSSEFPFFPGAQRIIRMFDDDKFGRIIEASSGLLHSSDLDPNKKINWKRIVASNGEYGCMGDLGLHTLHIPLRAGWMPQSVFASLSKIVNQRPNADGVLVACETWDNATLVGVVPHAKGEFPLTIQTYRIAPGETNTWYLRVIGTHMSAEFSSKFPKTFRFMDYQPGGEQAWRTIDLGYETVYPTITGGIFEFGFTDSILQMWAAFCDMLVNGKGGMMQPFYCATPEETAAHHRILTAALQSHRQRAAITTEKTV
jgi:predicted dehydrogenase